MLNERTLSADDVIITDRLSERPSRVPDYAAESRALEALAKELAEHPENMLQKLADTIVELGVGDSAGVSIEETAEVRRFRWVALAGVWSQLRGGTIPFNASPCGLAVQRDQLLLIESPERFFVEAAVEPLIHEGLLVPFHIDGTPVGTLWINLHSPNRTFDREDARLLLSLARFASAAHQMVLAYGASEAGRLESDHRLRALARASSDVFYIMSADMRELRELSGGNFIPDTTSPSRDWLQDYIPPEDHAQTIVAIQRAIQTKSVFELEHRVRQIDGEVGWAMSRAVPIVGADGEIVEWFGAASDVTARKLAEIAQRESEAKYRSLFQSIDDGFALIEFLPDLEGRQPDFRFLDVNEAFERQTGNRDVVGKLGSEINPGNDVVWIDMLGEIARTSSSRRLEIYHQQTRRWYNVFATRTGGDESRQVCVVFNDTTDRKSREAALRESEARHRLLVGTWSQAIWETDPEGAVVADSPSWRAYTGQTLEEWLGYGWLDAIHPDDRTYAEGQWRSAIDARRPVDAEFRLHAPDGGWRWTKVRAAPVIGAGGQVEKWAGINIDIDPRKRAEEALALSEQRLTLAATASKMGVWEWDLVNDLPVGNLFYYQHFDLEPFAAHCGVDVIAKLHPDDIAMMLATHAAAMDPASDGHYTVEYRVLRKGAGPRWLYSDGQVLFSGEGAERRPERSIGTSLDITEQKLAEERQAFLLKLSDVLRPLSDPAEVQATAAQLLGRHLGVDNSNYYEIDADGWATRSHGFETGAVAVPVRFPVAEFGQQWLDSYRAGRTVVISDSETDERFSASEREAWRANRLSAGLGVPLVKEGRLCATFGFNHAQPRSWTEAEVVLAEETAERTWAAVERARAETTMRESEKRLHQFGEASQDVLWIRDATTLQWTYLTPAFETIYGLSRDDALSGDDYRNWQDLIVPEDRAHAVAAINQVLAGEQVMFEYRVRRPSDGAIRWLRNTDFPISDGSGEIVSIGGVGHDMTDLKAIEAVIAESEGRLRTLMEGIPQLVWRSCAEGRWTWASPQWLDFTGQRQEESYGLGWLDVVHPDDRAATSLAWENATPNGALDVEFRVRRASDGAWLWHHTRSVPVCDADDNITEWLGTTTDVHALHELQDRQEVLVAELQHRTRNLITVVRSLSDRTVVSAASLDDFKGRFGRRLAALSRVQGLLSHLSAGERVDFDELLRSELSALGVTDSMADRVTLEGPARVPLRSATVQTFALALHELATNAVKYGALANHATDGRLSVCWHVVVATADGSPVLHVDWRESGVNMPDVGASPPGSGYGRELIERALPYQLGAETTYEMSADGVRCTIKMPLSEEGSGHQE